ncbi:hypothetical protein TBLA_0J01240 [Henningerozyma blattae CBS 6284]|uniref:Ribosomal RNA-processing protein 43 n=1 Tax=Henningerozyma blattae (strain ATCC 34711 / CBS 6284 / DSM 70876 / NBRC 10599 / NRRL Y-10934 / UCD 77-7) TaxID=1071380 RepID=I2H9R9_HENB6|nr:hypothetical protein TBLA_0J01240 [Tetrapisispora blattae CBS 6284]CCH63121.1 hypothetical protein TBLA_0J01240 [Tetrapisispora blattae CBS 6284]
MSDGTVEIIPITFPYELEAHITPDISLQKHLSLGLRPDLRKPEEFRSVNSVNNLVSRYSDNEKFSSTTTNNILGSNVLKCGNTTILTTITGSIVEENQTTDEDDLLHTLEEESIEKERQRKQIYKYLPVYPQVEIQRGQKFRGPSLEDMTTSYKLYENILHSGIINKEALRIKCGVRINCVNEQGKEELKIIYPDENNLSSTDLQNVQFPEKKRWSYILYAKIVVLGCTGPAFDHCWNSLIYALQSTRLPRAFIDERGVNLKMNIRTHGRSVTIRETYDLLCDSTKSIKLNINDSAIGFSSNFGILSMDPVLSMDDDEDDEKIKQNVEAPNAILLADLDTSMEEENIRSTMCIIRNDSESLKHVNLSGGDAKISLEILKKALLLSKLRSKDLSAVGSSKN